MPKAKVKLLTLNVFLRPPPIKTNIDDYKQQRFLEIMKIIQDYDIVCFQEMFQMGTFRPERIIQEAIRQKFYYWKMSEPPSFLPGPVVDSGLMVLSKYPIVHSYFQSYGIGILSDSASDKGYIYCKIKIGEELLHLFVTHLQASYKLQGRQFQRQLSVKTRLYQFQILLKRVAQHLKSNGHQERELVLLVGDLNVDSNEKPFSLSENSCLLMQGPITKGPKVNAQGSNTNGLLQNAHKDGFKEYLKVMSIFQQNHIEVIDHAYLQHKGHPVTFGDNQTILTGKEDTTSCQSLDYIFTLKMPQFKEFSTWKIDTSSCQVQQFKYPASVFGQLSDHYGMSAVIQ